MFQPQRAIIRCLVMLKLSHCIKYKKYIKCLLIHTMCKCCFMFNLLYIHLIFICLNQFYSLSNLILILKFHKIIIALLLGALSTCPKQSSSYSSIWNFYCSGLDIAYVHMPVVCYHFFYLYVAHFPCIRCCCFCLLVYGRLSYVLH
jgi:hypothetical protein